MKKLLKTTRNKKKKHNEIVILAWSKLNSIENKISEKLINNEISHADFMTIINEEINYREVKESLKVMKIPRIDTEKVILIEKGKNIGIDKIIKRNQSINNILQPQI